MAKKRLDVLLFEKGLCPSRERAKTAIMEGIVYIAGQKAGKAGDMVDENAELEVRGNDNAFVSRGGKKIEKALNYFAIDPSGLTVMDVGASTGGFTEYLLLRGAARVYAVDSGSGQLAAKLRRDARVVSMEKYNARLLSPKDFPVPPTFAVMDVSFISQTLILPALFPVLAERATLVSLVKPQFEAGREAIGKGGIVKNKADRAAAIRRVVDSAALCGFAFCEIAPSPITGGDGNEEFLCCFSKGGARPAYAGDVQRLIGQAVGMK